MINEHLSNAPEYQHRHQFRLRMKYCLVIGVELFHVSWLIYGNIIYYSKENKCGDSTSFLSLFMYAFLLMGYINLLIYALICFVLITHIYRLRQRRD